MATNFQNVQINIIDVDTKDIIQKDFTINLYPMEGDTYRTIRGGSDILCNFPVQGNLAIVFKTDIEKLGYKYADDQNPNFIVQVDSSQIAYMPWVVNIYLKKINP